MFLLPPPEGLEALGTQLQDAYSGITTQANSLFDAIGLTPVLEATRLDPSTMMALSAGLGVSPTSGAVSRAPKLGWLRGLLNRTKGIPKTQGSPGASVPVSTVRPAARTSSEMLRQAHDQATQTFMRVRNPIGIARGGEQMNKLKDLMRFSRPDAEYEALEAFPGLNAGVPKTASFEELQRKLAILRDLSREYGMDFGTLSRMGPR